MDDKKLQQCRDYQNKLLDIVSKAEDDFQHLVMGLGAGTLGLSLTLLSLLTDFRQSQFIYFLIAGWALLIAALCLALCASRSSSIRARKTIKDIDSEISKPTGDGGVFNDVKIQKRIGDRNKSNDRSTAWIIWLLLSGIIVVLTFAVLHILTQEPKQEQNNCCISCEKQQITAN